GVHVVILPAPVQGEGAEEIIAAQIRRANRYGMADVLIIGRGGGSLEDLLPFSGEEVVRAVAESRIPVISAVGHEVDIALSDYAADFRAPTPSAAAEAVSAAREELLRRVQECRSGIQDALLYRAEKIRLLLDRFTPGSLEQQFQILLQPVLFRLDDAKESLVAASKLYAAENRGRLNLARATLESCSPLDILKRGYSIVRLSRPGKVVKSASGLAAGNEILIHFHEGEADATVKEVRP
ncbi:MAG: exodeoxyribonuclease VII large subunit, partial [Spirochaetales bacterium]|nr:exodeoxyribonuclease VII large subunit [Spirochaetales bacterium]